MTKRPFNAKGRRAQALLELVYTNVCGPMSTQAKEVMSTSSLLRMITQDMVMCT